MYSGLSGLTNFSKAAEESFRRACQTTEENVNLIRELLFALDTAFALIDGYIDADSLHPNTFSLQSCGGPYISETSHSESALRSNLPETRAVSTGRCNTGLEFTSRSFKAQGFPWALIEAQGYFV
jgi:hypothetical protein